VVIEEIMECRGATSVSCPFDWYETEEVARSGYLRVSDNWEVIYMTSRGGHLVRVWAGPAGDRSWWPSNWRRRHPAETLDHMRQRIRRRKEAARRRLQREREQDEALRRAAAERDRQEAEAAKWRLTHCECGAEIPPGQRFCTKCAEAHRLAVRQMMARYLRKVREA